MNIHMNPPLFFPFTSSDVDYVLHLAKELGRCSTHGRWFRNLSVATVKIDTSEQEGDLLCISECWVTKELRDNKYKFVASIPEYIPSNSRWEPDDVDTREVGEYDTLTDAMIRFYLLEAETFARDAVTAVTHERLQSTLKLEDFNR